MTPIHRLDKAPIIYISLGTTHINQKLSFYQKCIDALRNTSYFVVISLSEQIQTSELKNLSSNILLLPYVNQLSILSKAHLFITHGGANGFNEACYYGVPMLVFPQQGDQFDVADRVVELHIGTKANDEAVTCDDLKGLIHDLLSDSSVAQQISCLSSRLKEEPCKIKSVRCYRSIYPRYEEYISDVLYYVLLPFSAKVYTGDNVLHTLNLCVSCSKQF